MTKLDSLEQKIREGINKFKGVSDNTCWLDGGACPYGFPAGRFDQRPEQFCVVPSNKSGGCNKLQPFAEVFNDMIIERIKEERQSDIEAKIEQEKITLDSELRVVVDVSKEMKNGLSEEETRVLLLAADIIEKNDHQNDPEHRDYIVRVRDIL